VDAVKAAAVDRKPGRRDPAGRPVPGDYCGGSEYRNRTDPQLPTHDTLGRPISYVEYDVDPYDGVSRNGRRIVVGSDFSHYYTDNHYADWTRFR